MGHSKDSKEGKSLVKTENAVAVKDSNHVETFAPGAHLLADADKLIIRSAKMMALDGGHPPDKRPIEKYLQTGCINLDKPSNPSSHEVVSWVKRMIHRQKTGHSGTLDPKVTGCLIVCLDKATRLVKSQQGAGKEYISIIRFHDKVEGGVAEVASVLEDLRGALFQRPPLISAVKRQLRIRTIYDIKLLEFDNDRKLGVFHVSCEAGTYIRTLCEHIGLLLGVGAHMQELRRVKSGHLDETNNLSTLHDLFDAYYLYEHQRDESALRKVVMPLESLLVNYPKIMIKDTAVAAVCYGAQLTASGVMAFSDNIDPGDTVVIMTTKGEAVALAIATVGSTQLGTVEHNAVCRLKRVIMDRDEYPRRWGNGSFATQKKQLAAAGKLGKHGEPIESTPTEYRDLYNQLHTSGGAAIVETVQATKTEDKKGEEVVVETVVETKRKHADETPEERAERKRAKKEKKAAKAAQEA